MGFFKSLFSSPQISEEQQQEQVSVEKKRIAFETLRDGGVLCGLPRDKARRMAAQMLLGSAKLALESGDHTGQMKDAICSPGGTTIAGVRKLESMAFRSAAMEAVIAAYDRTEELKKQEAL